VRAVEVRVRRNACAPGRLDEGLRSVEWIQQVGDGQFAPDGVVVVGAARLVLDRLK